MDSLKSTLRFIEQMKMKPNYSELSRRYNMDRHTIKKMMEGLNDPPKGRRPRPSALDPLAGEIAQVMAVKGVSAAGAYWYFKNERGITCTYSNFKQYVRRKELSKRAAGEPDATPHPLYETDPGDVLQVDWVEDLSLTTRGGEAVSFNLFSATLGYSRLHYFEFTETKTEGAFKRCLCHCLRFLGGRPKKVLTDNMSAIVNVRAERKKVHESVTQFFRDIGVELRLCKVRTPETKGKDESSNRFAKWLRAYDGKIGSARDVPPLVKALVRDINLEENQMTGVPPAVAFGKEKEHLGALPSEGVMREYESWSHSCRVPQTMLVYYHSARYSVPPNLITKTVQIEEDSGRVYIYHAGFLVAEHEAAPGGANYDESHLRAGLEASSGASADSIDEYIGRTMSRFKDMAER